MGAAASAALAHDKQTGTIDAIAAHIDAQPGIVIDFTEKSGEYCLNYGFGKGGVMVHYAEDPAKTTEDTIEFVDARPLIEARMDVAKLPLHDGQLGTMRPNTWYYLPAGELEPHHGAKMPFPILMRASNLQ
jgi:hypothetical protein